MVNSLDSPMKRNHRPDYRLALVQAVGVLTMVKHLNTVNIALTVNYLIALVNSMTLTVMMTALNSVNLRLPLDYVVDS